MTEFECQVATADGQRSQLRRSAVSRVVLVRDLNTEGYLILDVVQVDSDRVSLGARIRTKDVLKFTEILATLTANGLNLKAALALAKSLGGKDLGPFLTRLDAQVQKGNGLHQSLAEGPRGFSPLYLGLIRIGEQTGDLASILPRLAEYLRSRQAVRERTINALVYPGFVLAVALIGVVLLSVFVLPVLTDTIGGVNPDVARAYRENVSAFQTTIGLLVGLLGVLVTGGLALAFAGRRSPTVALRVDSALLRLPFVGSLLWQTFGLHVSFSLEILLNSGFSLESALGESAAVVTNRAIRQAWGRVRERVVKGSPLSRALKEEGIFPEVLLGWVEVGESAHDLRGSFRQLRTFYQGQTEVWSSRFTSLAEPTLIVFVGTLVILLVITFITPIFTMLGRLF